jgi:hypothetical protein
MKSVIKVKHITGVRNRKGLDWDYLYTVGDMDTLEFFIEPKYGYIDWFSSEAKAQAALDADCDIAKPFDDSDGYELTEIDNNLCVRDFSTMEQIGDGFLDEWDFVRCVQNGDFSESEFENFCFPEESDGDDGDYDGGDYYDATPSYYDPRYDGPYHYIPAGNH